MQINKHAFLQGFQLPTAMGVAIEASQSLKFGSLHMDGKVPAPSKMKNYFNWLRSICLLQGDDIRKYRCIKQELENKIWQSRENAADKLSDDWVATACPKSQDLLPGLFVMRAPKKEIQPFTQGI